VETATTSAHCPRSAGLRPGRCQAFSETRRTGDRRSTVAIGIGGRVRICAGCDDSVCWSGIPGQTHLIHQLQAEKALWRIAKVICERQRSASSCHRIPHRRPSRRRKIVFVFELISLTRYGRPVQEDVCA